MTYLKDLHDASFRGLPFHIMEPPETEVGRRTAEHEYAGRDEPYSEDMGRAQRSYTITGAVNGNDYISKINALQDAFEEEGAGLLIHPYYGELYVTGKARIKIESRFASFVFSCKEAGHSETPTRTLDTQQAITDKSIAAETAAIESFSGVFDVSGPAFIQQESAAHLIEQLEQSVSNATELADTIAANIRQPADLAASVFAQLSSLKSAANSPLSTLEGYSSTSQSSGSVVAINTESATPSRAKITANNQATDQLIEQALAINSATLLPEIDFEHQAQAESSAKTVTSMLEQAVMSADDQSYRAITDLKIAVQQDIQTRKPALPQFQTVSLPTSTPALVAAYRYTGSADNEQQIIDRNNITHPGFVRGEIEVINA